MESRLLPYAFARDHAVLAHRGATPDTGVEVWVSDATAPRAIAEVGAIIMVGGNIRGATRTMTTAIALETSRGDLPLALGLGLVLLVLTLVVSALAFALNRAARSF